MRAFTRSFLLFAAILLVAELVTRFGFVRTMEGRFDYGYHPTAGFVEEGGKVELQRAGGRRFFPQSFQQRRPEGVYRVMVIGDSVARGKDVERSYAGQLQKELRTQGIPAECFNLGLPGFGARRKDLVVQQVLKYEPSLVILHVGISNEYEDEREWRRRDDFNSPHPKNWLMHSMVLRQLYEMKTEKLYWEWLPREVRSKDVTVDANAELRAATNKDTQKEWLKLVETVTRQSVQRIQDAGVPALIVSQATREKTSQGRLFLDDTEIDAWTASLVSDKIARLPMKSVFTTDQARALYTDSNHVRTEGHTLIAQAIARLLKERGWLPEPAQK